MGLHTATRAQCLALRATLPATWSAVFQCLAPPCISYGISSPGACCCLALVRKFDGLEDVAHTCDGVGLGEHCGSRGWNLPVRVGTTAPLSK